MNNFLFYDFVEITSALLRNNAGSGRVLLTGHCVIHGETCVVRNTGVVILHRRRVQYQLFHLDRRRVGKWNSKRRRAEVDNEI